MLSKLLPCIAAAIIPCAVFAQVPEHIEWKGNTAVAAKAPSHSAAKTLEAFTKDGDLYIRNNKSGDERRLTEDGGGTILNGRASWVYYEEIFGRASAYKAFWWSPDSTKLAFYRFDESQVPVFPIYSPKGQDGELLLTRYPKAGEPNPSVSIFIADIQSGSIVKAAFPEGEDCYYGTPFWSPDSRHLIVQKEPRRQNHLELYRVNPASGDATMIYSEDAATWLEWCENLIFQGDGLYMARDFESSWQQIYYLSLDGKTLKRITDGENWRVELLRAGKSGVYFLAERDSHIRRNLYKVSAKGVVTPVTDLSLYTEKVSFSPDGKYVAAVESGLDTPRRLSVYPAAKSGKGKLVFKDEGLPSGGKPVSIFTADSLELPGIIYYPAGFDPSKQYPVHVDIYGGPDTPLVRDRYHSPERYSWYSQNGIIELVADCRAAGHNGRKGLDAVFCHLNTVEVQDFILWGKWLQSLPYVKADKIGVEGFSFGGTMTVMLLATASEYFHYGIAGGGVYDWRLYDTHYTERFMLTPEENPEGYRNSAVINKVSGYKGDESTMLRLSHGTADDNVHFQNTLQLADTLQRQNSRFELMVYPDGKHGYRGAQGVHYRDYNRDFWLEKLTR